MGRRRAESSVAKLASIIKSEQAFSGSKPMANGRGGVEAAFYDNWSMKLEYLYIATKNLTGSSALPLGLGTVTESANVRDNIIRLGINYRFGPTGLVAY